MKSIARVSYPEEVRFSLLTANHKTVFEISNTTFKRSLHGVYIVAMLSMTSSIIATYGRLANVPVGLISRLNCLASGV